MGGLNEEQLKKIFDIRRERLGPEVSKIFDEINLHPIDLPGLFSDAVTHIMEELAEKKRELELSLERNKKQERRIAKLEETERRLMALYTRVTNNLNGQILEKDAEIAELKKQIIGKDLAISELETELGKKVQETVE